MERALMAILADLILLAVATVLVGCAPVQVGPKEIALPPPRTACPPLPPIPETVHIDIAPNQKPHADAGGLALLRAYVRARNAARQP